MFTIPRRIALLVTGLISCHLLFFSGLVDGNAHYAHNEYEELGFYPQKEHSLSKPYQGTGMTIPNWDFMGGTMVTNSFIRLTPDVQSRTGGIWNKNPINFPNWEVILEFKVHGKGKDLFGDGMAFWYIKHPMQPGNVFGGADYFWGLGLFLDTYANQNGVHSHGHPYISSMINNASLAYDHDRDGTHTELAGCESKFRGVEHDTYLSIRYYNDTLSVRTDVDGTGNWDECFVAEGVRLPTGLYLGVTAATGELSDNHDIISLKTYMLETPPEQAAKAENRWDIIPSALHTAPHRDHVDDIPPPTSWKRGFFYFFVVILVIIVLGIGGFLFWQKKQETNRKRFY